MNSTAAWVPLVVSPVNMMIFVPDSTPGNDATMAYSSLEDAGLNFAGSVESG